MSQKLYEFDDEFDNPYDSRTLEEESEDSQEVISQVEALANALCS